MRAWHQLHLKMGRMDLSAYSETVREILSHTAPMPLVQHGDAPDHVRHLLAGMRARSLFPDARSPEAALAGLWLRAGGWEQSHGIAQDLGSSEGSYWHAIVHRQEPDAWNSGYWFRRVGNHQIFTALRIEALSIASRYADAGFVVKDTWDPVKFIGFCTGPASTRGSAAEAAALAVQEAEWWLLFDWCAGVK